MRKLATIRRLAELHPIAGADLIELAIVDGWQCVVKKNEFAVGDLVVYCEVDSFLPLLPPYEFLRKSSYQKLPDGTEGFRLRTMRLRGQLSQGLLLPRQVVWPTELAEDGSEARFPYAAGDDVTERLGITKYEPPVPAILSGVAKGFFPAWLPKTEEERVQNCWEQLPKDVDYVATEKLHGTSATFYLRDDEFGVCSRNLDLKDEGNTVFWRLARELRLAERLRALQSPGGLAVQGEIIGEGINGNYYRLTGHQFRAFNFFDEAQGGYLPHAQAEARCLRDLGVHPVPVVSVQRLPATLPELLAAAEGPSTYEKQPVREGLVLRHYRADGRRISCKVISNTFLLNEK